MTDEFTVLRSYPAPWEGELLLVCNKCVKKLKKSKQKDGLANPKKWFKKRTKSAEKRQQVRVIGVNCVKMCPKNAVTVATQEQLSRTPAQVSILHSEADLEKLYQLLRGRLPA